MIHVPRSVTVLVDTREKQPLLFPRRIEFFPYGVHRLLRGAEPSIIGVRTKRRTLKVADYTVEKWEHLTAAEKKGGIDELITNVSAGDIARFRMAIVAFATSVRHPFLFLTCLPTSVWCASPRNRSASVARVLDIVLATAADLDLQLIWGGRASPLPGVRRRLGDIILRAMLHKIVAESNK
jgi:hypothetical protein